VINALRAHLAELGIVAAQGREGLKQLLAIISDEKDTRLPIDARASLVVLAALQLAEADIRELAVLRSTRESIQNGQLVVPSARFASAR
jgi:transposase